jgi:RNA polymerase II subunit A small phosphatase-like protein
LVIGSSPSKPSFFSRVVNKVVPCVTPTDSSPPPADQPKDTQNGEIELVDTKVADPSPSTGEPPSTLPQQQESRQALVDDPMTPVPAEVIVSPAVQLLPIEETDGVTSGAVQPPGSTGEPIARIPTNDSSMYPDSIIDEEVAMLDEQEEEERLIRNGGNGIPIGPVSILSASLLSPLTSMTDRMASQNHYYLLLHHSTPAGNVWCWISTRHWFIAALRYLICPTAQSCCVRFMALLLA